MTGMSDVVIRQIRDLVRKLAKILLAFLGTFPLRVVCSTFAGVFGQYFGRTFLLLGFGILQEVWVTSLLWGSIRLGDCGAQPE